MLVVGCHELTIDCRVLLSVVIAGSWLSGVGWWFLCPDFIQAVFVLKMLISHYRRFRQEIKADQEHGCLFQLVLDRTKPIPSFRRSEIRAAQIFYFPKQAETDVSEQGLEWKRSFLAGFHENAGL
jgi:hypothetical protein